MAGGIPPHRAWTRTDSRFFAFMLVLMAVVAWVL